jgi:hypothetical protein
MVLDVSHYRNCVMHAIGERPYKVIFGQLREEQKNILDQESTPQGVMRVHDGQIMGQVVKDSLTQKITEGPHDQGTLPTPNRLDTAGRQQERKVALLLRLHDTMETIRNIGPDGSTLGIRLTPLRETRVPPGLHDPSTIHDVGHHDGG